MQLQGEEEVICISSGSEGAAPTRPARPHAAGSGEAVDLVGAAPLRSQPDADFVVLLSASTVHQRRRPQPSASLSVSSPAAASPGRGAAAATPAPPSPAAQQQGEEREGREVVMVQPTRPPSSTKQQGAAEESGESLLGRAPTAAGPEREAWRPRAAAPSGSACKPPPQQPTACGGGGAPAVQGLGGSTRLPALYGVRQAAQRAAAAAATASQGRAPSGFQRQPLRPLGSSRAMRAQQAAELVRCWARGGVGRRRLRSACTCLLARRDWASKYSLHLRGPRAAGNV